MFAIAIVICLVLIMCTLTILISVLCVFMVENMYVVFDECDEPTSCLLQTVGAHGGEVMYFWRVCFRGELGSRIVMISACVS